MLPSHPSRDGGLVYSEHLGSLRLGAEVIDQLDEKSFHGLAPYGNAHNNRYGDIPLQGYGRTPNNPGMEFKDRLKQARKARKMSQVRLSEATGLDQTTISNLETGKVLSTSKVVQLAHALQINAHWLATGHGEMTGNVETMRHRQEVSSNAELVDIEIVEGDEPLRPDEVWLPVFREVEFAAGDGSTQVQENHGARERFSLARLSRSGVQPENAALAVAKGDSMTPAIRDGATIGIDKGCRTIRDGEVYALDHDGMLRIKYLYRLPLNRVRVVSENSIEYPEEVYSLGDPDAPRILGRVFMAENFF